MKPWDQPRQLLTPKSSLFLILKIHINTYMTSALFILTPYRNDTLPQLTQQMCFYNNIWFSFFFTKVVTFSSSLLCVFFLLTIYTSSVNRWLVFFLLIGHKKEGEGEGILQYSYLQKGGAAENLKEPLPWMMKKEVTKSWQCIYDKITLSLKSFSSPPFIFILVYFCPCPGNWKENLRAHSHHLLTHEMTLSSDTYCILLFYVMSFFF